MNHYERRAGFKKKTCDNQKPMKSTDIKATELHQFIESLNVTALSSVLLVQKSMPLLQKCPVEVPLEGVDICGFSGYHLIANWKHLLCNL